MEGEERYGGPCDEREDGHVQDEEPGVRRGEGVVLHGQDDGGGPGEDEPEEERAPRQDGARVPRASGPEVPKALPEVRPRGDLHEDPEPGEDDVEIDGP